MVSSEGRCPCSYVELCGGRKLATAMVLRRAVRREGSAAAAVAARSVRRFDNFRPTICAAKMIIEVWRTARIAEVEDGDESENEIEIRIIRTQTRIGWMLSGVVQ